MKRIEIYYDGHHYSVGDRELSEMQKLIEAGQSGTGSWLLVNAGEGTRRDAYLWIAPSIPIALIPIPGDDDE